MKTICYIGPLKVSKSLYFFTSSVFCKVCMFYSLIQRSPSLIKKRIFFYILCFSILTQHHVAFTQGDKLEALSPHTEFMQKLILDYYSRIDRILDYQNIRVLKNLLAIDNYQSWPAIVSYLEERFVGDVKTYRKLLSALSPSNQPINSSKELILRENFESPKTVCQVTFADMLELRITTKAYERNLYKPNTLRDNLKITQSCHDQLLRKIAYQFNQLALHTDLMLSRINFMPPLHADYISTYSDHLDDVFEDFIRPLDLEKRQLLVTFITDEILKSVDLKHIPKETFKKILNYTNLFSFYKNLLSTYFRNCTKEGYLPRSEFYDIPSEKIVEIKDIVPLTPQCFNMKQEEILALFVKEDPNDAEEIAHLLGQFISTFQYFGKSEYFLENSKYRTFDHYILRGGLRHYYQKLCRINPKIANQFIQDLFNEMDFFLIRRSEKLDDFLKEHMPPEVYEPENRTGFIPKHLSSYIILYSALTDPKLLD